MWSRASAPGKRGNELGRSRATTTLVQPRELGRRRAAPGDEPDALDAVRVVALREARLTHVEELRLARLPALAAVHLQHHPLALEVGKRERAPVEALEAHRLGASVRAGRRSWCVRRAGTDQYAMSAATNGSAHTAKIAAATSRPRRRRRPSGASGASLGVEDDIGGRPPKWRARTTAERSCGAGRRPRRALSHSRTRPSAAVVRLLEDERRELESRPGAIAVEHEVLPDRIARRVGREARRRARPARSRCLRPPAFRGAPAPRPRLRVRPAATQPRFTSTCTLPPRS